MHLLLELNNFLERLLCDFGIIFVSVAGFSIGAAYNSSRQRELRMPQISWSFPQSSRVESKLSLSTPKEFNTVFVVESSTSERAIFILSTISAYLSSSYIWVLLTKVNLDLLRYLYFVFMTLISSEIFLLIFPKILIIFALGTFQLDEWLLCE